MGESLTYFIQELDCLLQDSNVRWSRWESMRLDAGGLRELSDILSVDEPDGFRLGCRLTYTCITFPSASLQALVISVERETPSVDEGISRAFTKWPLRLC